MNTYISLLRGINVSGQKSIRMAELKSLYESLNLVNVATYVQSGNVLFDSKEKETSQLRELIESQIEQTFGFSVNVFIRDIHDFKRIISKNPFLNKRKEDIAKLYVIFLYDFPHDSRLRNMQIPVKATEQFIVGEKEIFLFCPNGYGRAKLTNNFFENKLGTAATTRNWKTVTTLYNMINKRLNSTNYS